MADTRKFVPAYNPAADPQLLDAARSLDAWVDTIRDVMPPLLHPMHWLAGYVLDLHRRIATLENENTNLIAEIARLKWGEEDASASP